VLALGLVASTVAMPLIMPSFDETAALYHGVRAPPPSTLHRLYARALNPSTIHRLFIWRFAGDRIAERPLWGWGMDAARDIPGGQLDLSTAYPQAVLPANARALPLHPHNATVEWRLDLGIPGAVLMLAILVWGLYRLGWHGALSANRRAGSLAWATSAIIIGCVSYGFWQAWWLACLWLGAALLAAPGTAAPVRDGR
jgi:O-antigen ligase